MLAPAAAPDRRDRLLATSRGRFLSTAGRLLLLIVPMTCASPAQGQVALSLAAESDYRFRGYSLSGGRPTASVSLAYDHPSGIYLNGSLIGVHRRDDEDLLGYQANAGYARRITPSISLDAGVIHSRYRFPYYGTTDSRGYTEAYVGAHVRDFAARVYYSPRYFYEGVSTGYGEVQAAYQPAPNWRLSAHAGLLVYLTSPAYSDRRARHDWRLSASRQFGRVEVHAAVSGGGPGRDYYDGEFHDRTAITFGGSLNF